MKIYPVKWSKQYEYDENRALPDYHADFHGRRPG